MCDCATELERKRREIENRSSLKSRSASRVSSCCSVTCSGETGESGDDDNDGRPGLLRAIMRFLRGRMSLSEVAPGAGFSGASTGNLGVVGGLVGGGVLLAILGMLFKLQGQGSGESTGWNFNLDFSNWRKAPERNCTPKPAAGEGPPKINKQRLKWPPEDDE